MKYAYPLACILAMACALWIAYAAEQQQNTIHIAETK